MPSFRPAHSKPHVSGRGHFVRVVRLLASVVLVACLALLGCLLFQQWYQSDSYEKLSSAVELDVGSDTNPTLSDFNVDWDALSKVNPDIVGWIYVPGTPINYPVVKGNDNEEYLSRSFDGSEGWLASKGTLFVSSENKKDLSDRNIVIFGHHMRDGSMFACLDDWRKQDVFDAHRDLFFLSPDGNYRLRTFSRFDTTGSDRIVRTDFSDDGDFGDYVVTQARKSLVSAPDIDPASVNQTFMLSTCEYSHSDGRAIVFASVVETTNPNDPFVAVSGHPLELSSEDVSGFGLVD